MSTYQCSVSFYFCDFTEKSLNNSKQTEVLESHPFSIVGGKIANVTSTLVQSTGKFCSIRPWNFPEIHTGIMMVELNAPRSRKCLLIVAKEYHLRLVRMFFH